MQKLIDVDSIQRFIRHIFSECVLEMNKNDKAIIRKRGFSDACGQIIEWTDKHGNDGYWHDIDESPDPDAFRVVAVNANGVYRVLPVVGLRNYMPPVIAWAYVPDYEGRD